MAEGLTSVRNDIDSQVEITTGYEGENLTTYIMSTPRRDGGREIIKSSGDLLYGRIYGIAKTEPSVEKGIAFGNMLEGDGRFVYQTEEIKIGDMMVIEQLPEHTFACSRPIVKIEIF